VGDVGQRRRRQKIGAEREIVSAATAAKVAGASVGPRRLVAGIRAAGDGDGENRQERNGTSFEFHAAPRGVPMGAVITRSDDRAVIIFGDIRY
jgi:hypothetical protein